jgi:CubicO group peptidase (beta-lactamase class C family)
MPIVRCVGAVVLAFGIVAGCASHPGPPAGSADPAKADTVMRVVHDFMAQAHLKAVIVRVTVDGKEILTQAVGDSMTGVPATTDMHFRNGAVAISYVSTLLLKLVDQKKVSLDDSLSKWLPHFPHSERVTLGQLAQMTSGYPDYILGNDAFDNLFYVNPFRQWTIQDILAQMSSRPLLYDPGTNWNYAHTNYVLLGLALEKATGQEIPPLLQNEVFAPLGRKATANSDTPAIPQPALHAENGVDRSAWQDTVEAYLPARKVGVAVAVTYAPEAFDDQGNYSNQADILFHKIGAVVAPNNAPPMPPGR